MSELFFVRYESELFKVSRYESQLFFFQEKSPAADVDNVESPRGQPAKSGTMRERERER